MSGNDGAPLATVGEREAATRLILAIDTAISTAVVGLGRMDGRPIATDSWQAGYRHGEELLVRVDRLLHEAGLGLADLGAIVVGTGPGAFTGLRVGLATAKALAYGLGIPIVGVPTAQALVDAALGDPSFDRVAARPRSRGAGADTDGHGLALVLPAGPSDRMLVVDGSSRLLPGGQEPDLPVGVELVAVDLDGRAPDEASSLGAQAVRGLAAALLALGAGRLAAGERDDVARLVPEYVTLPRGTTSATGEVRWSRGQE